LNRDEIYRFVRSKDPNGVIAKKLIGWVGDSNDTYIVTDRCWNGSMWECYICHRKFGTSNGLKQHINSDTRMSARSLSIFYMRANRLTENGSQTVRRYTIAQICAVALTSSLSRLS
jgi:hypothetical protein